MKESKRSERTEREDGEKRQRGGRRWMAPGTGQYFNRTPRYLSTVSIRIIPLGTWYTHTKSRSLKIVVVTPIFPLSWPKRPLCLRPPIRLCFFPLYPDRLPRRRKREKKRNDCERYPFIYTLHPDSRVSPSFVSWQSRAGCGIMRFLNQTDWMELSAARLLLSAKRS